MKNLFASIFWFTSLLLTNAASVSFDNYVNQQDNDLVNSFRVMYASGAPVLSQIPSGGITGGSLQFSNTRNYAEAIYLPSMFRNGAGDSNRVSGFFRVSSDPFSEAILGFSTRSDSIQLSDGPSPLNGGACTIYYAPASGMQLVSRSGTTGYASPVLPLALSTNNWYRFSLSVVENPASSDFTLTGTVEDYGISGTDNPFLLGTATLTRPNPAMLATPTVYSGLAGWAGNAAFTLMRFDNFQANGVEVAPEPTVLGLALLGVGVAALVHVRTRARSNTSG